MPVISPEMPVFLLSTGGKEVGLAVCGDFWEMNCQKETKTR